MKTIAERFWEKVEVVEGCWIWKGVLTSRDPKLSYGRIMKNGKNRPAAQISWELRHGRDFPTGMDALHSCDNPRCVNPDHIFPGTAHDNAMDAVRKGRMVSNNLKKESCPHGHPYFGSNLFVRKNGVRECRTCMRLRSRNRYRELEAPHLQNRKRIFKRRMR